MNSSSIWIEFFHYKPFWGSPIYGNPPILMGKIMVHPNNLVADRIIFSEKELNGHQELHLTVQQPMIFWLFHHKELYHYCIL